jgi:homoserine kinase type II
MVTVSVARFTSLSQTEFVDVCDAFQCGNFVAASPLLGGTVNSNVELTTSAGKYFLRVNEGKMFDDVAWEARLLNVVASAGVPVLLPLQTSTGKSALQSKLNGKWISLFPWIDGFHVTETMTTPTLVSQIATALAHMHQVTEQMLPVLYRASRYDFTNIQQRQSQCRNLGDTNLAAPLDLLTSELDQIASAAVIRTTSPVAIIHGDLFRDNVLLKRQDNEQHALHCLLDFEQASAGSTMYDLAVVIHDWCWDTTSEQPKWSHVAAAVNGYHSVRPMLQLTEALFWELRMAAVRFTTTRITDVYLAGLSTPDKDFRAFLARARFWREPSAFERLAQLTRSLHSG